MQRTSLQGNIPNAMYSIHKEQVDLKKRTDVPLSTLFSTPQKDMISITQKCT